MQFVPQLPLQLVPHLTLQLGLVSVVCTLLVVDVSVPVGLLAVVTDVALAATTITEATKQNTNKIANALVFLSSVCIDNYSTPLY